LEVAGKAVIEFADEYVAEGHSVEEIMDIVESGKINLAELMSTVKIGKVLNKLGVM
jgi:hypothetical protein